jgi:hypothetical protein
MRVHPLSELQVISHGILKLTLGAQGYDWEFLQPAGTRADIGSDVCH